MILKLLLSIFIVAALAHPQVRDSVYIDTSKTGKIDTVATDTTGFLSTQKTITKKDTVIPVYQTPYYSSSTFIDRKEKDFLDYRYTGDLFQHFGLSFLRNYGFVGYPNELYLYGTNEVSYFENGIYANNRVSGYYNLNLMPSELIDSIEIVPAPRGFLLGPVNSPVSINFIKRDIYSLRPYTRIKFYQGPSGDAFIDALFNAIIFKDFAFTFDISNRKVDSSYSNSDFSIWQGEARLKYYLSDKINIIASYGYNHYNVGLDGGVNVDSIKQLTSNIDVLLYSELQAPVYYSKRRNDIREHNISLRLLAETFSNSQTDFSLYYRFNNNEVSNPVNGFEYPQRDKNKSAGALFRQDFSLAFADLKIITQYEKTQTRISEPGLYSDLNMGYFTFAPIFSLNLIDSTITPSFFYKLQNISNGSSNLYHGLGFDASLKLLDFLKLYGGYSVYKSLNLSDNVNSLELSAKFNFENIKFNADFINRSESYLYVDPSVLSAGDGYYIDVGTSLVGGNLSIKLWKILLETTAYYDLSTHKPYNNNAEMTIVSPKIKLTGGIYLDGEFFKDNLNLKTGFAFNFNSKQRGYLSGNEYDLADRFVTVDYTLAGEIQKVAVAYFTWENLFDETYYIVPYYPMFRRGIRFGVAWELFN